MSDDGLDDRPTERWWQARRLNSAVLALAPTLMRLRSTGVVALRLEDTREPWELLADGRSALRNISRGSFTVGSFVFEEQETRGSAARGGERVAVLLQNYAWTYTQTPTVDLGGGRTPMEVDQHSGELVPVADEILGLPGLQVGLVAGGGRLFVLGAAYRAFAIKRS